MKKLTFILVLMGIALALLAVINPETEYTGWRGVVENRGDKVWLKEQFGSEMRLLLGPQALMDSLGLVLADGDSIYVEGFKDKDLFLVGKLWKESGECNLYWLRHLDEGSMETGELATYNVDTKKCIGCRLCNSPCPTGAITMIKNKAYIDPEKCTECGICIEGYDKFKGCPVKAINRK